MNKREFYQMIDDVSSDLHSGCSDQEELEGSLPDMADNLLSDPEIRGFVREKIGLKNYFEQKEFIEGLLG
jgi:hypothetical protein